VRGTAKNAVDHPHGGALSRTCSSDAADGQVVKERAREESRRTATPENSPVVSRPGARTRETSMETSSTSRRRVHACRTALTWQSRFRTTEGSSFRIPKEGLGVRSTGVRARYGVFCHAGLASAYALHYTWESWRPETQAPQALTVSGSQAQQRASQEIHGML